jgi:transposase
MYIERVPNRNSPPAVLLRESYREGDKVRKRTLANLSKLPDEVIENLQIVLKGGVAVENYGEAFQIIRSLPHGHVAAVLGTLNKLGIAELIDHKISRKRSLIIGMIVARILEPRSKLATARGLKQETCFSSIGKCLNLEKADEDELYSALDWLLERQEKIEKSLAQKHLEEGSLVLYDVSSTYFEGDCCPLAQYGYSRDRKKGKKQIVFGLLCNQEGCPIAVEVFQGNINDSTTLGQQIEKVRSRFGFKRIVWVGDRGMITAKRINEELKKQEGLDWITALTAVQIRKLAQEEVIQLGLFDERNLVELSDDAYVGERLIACRNPLIAQSKSQKREKLLLATEEELNKIVTATQREKRALKGADVIGLRVGKVINKYQVGKFFDLQITENSFSYSRKMSTLQQEITLDGLYVIRTSVARETLDTPATVRTYKSLSHVEQAFRSYKSVDLKVRPIYHYSENRVRAHVFLCMLAYYVEWHLKRTLSSLLFVDEDWELNKKLPGDVVSPAKRSQKALSKARTKKTN